MADIDAEVAKLSNEIVCMDNEINKALPWLDRLNYMRADCLIRQKQHQENLTFLKQEGIISSAREYKAIREDLKRANFELGQLEFDINVLEKSVKRIKDRLITVKEKYEHALSTSSRRGVLLTFKRKILEFKRK